MCPDIAHLSVADHFYWEASKNTKADQATEVEVLMNLQ